MNNITYKKIPCQLCEILKSDNHQAVQVLTCLLTLHVLKSDDTGMLRMAPLFIVLGEECPERNRPPREQKYRICKNIQVGPERCALQNKSNWELNIGRNGKDCEGERRKIK